MVDVGWAEGSEVATSRHISLIEGARESTSSLLNLPNVNGTAIGFRQISGDFKITGNFADDICFQVFVERKYPPEALPEWALVPKEIWAGTTSVRTDVIESGYFQPLALTERQRPIPGGCSFGAATRPNAGTLGGWAHDEDENQRVWITCNHVVTLQPSHIPDDDRVVQPGRRDGGVLPGDVIGHTRRVVPIATDRERARAPANELDVAIGVATEDGDECILDIGPAIKRVGVPRLGMSVRKTGRSTGLTTNGRIISVAAEWLINYGTGSDPRYANIGGNSIFNVGSLDGDPFAARGDSGALVVTEDDGSDPCVLGVLFAGGVLQSMPFGSLIGVCDIGAVFRTLNLRVL